LHKFRRTDWVTGKALVKMCSEDNNQVCAQIARRLMLSSSRKWRSTAAHTPRSVQLQPNGTDPEMMAGGADGGRRQVRREANYMSSQEAMAYQDQADSGNIWTQHIGSREL